MRATIQRFQATDELERVLAALDADGAVIVEGLLSSDVVDRVNEEVEPAIRAADPSAPMFNDVMQDFHGPCTKQVSGMPGISRTFATDVMCNPLLLAVAGAVLGPSCARFQLNIGHLLQRGPGAEDQLLHRDELVWSDVPRPDPDQIAYAEMPAGAAVIYTGGVLHGGGANTTEVPRRGAHLSYCVGWLRTEENNYLAVPPELAATLPRQAQEVLGYATHERISRGGGYLGMLRMQDPVDLLQRGEL